MTINKEFNAIELIMNTCLLSIQERPKRFVPFKEFYDRLFIPSY